MDTKKLQHFEVKGKINNYKGIRIYASDGLHEKVFELINNLKLDKEIKILILGSGGGAFDLRLLDNGYTNITSIDYIDIDYKVKGTNFLSRDLNKDFDDLGKFDLIIALEIIEHLENQFKFINNCYKCLKNDGNIILSTPNIESRFSRTWFWLFGEIPYFSNYALLNSGHITPIIEHILKFNLNENGFKILSKHTNKSLWKIDTSSLRSIISGAILFILMLFSRGDNNDLNIYHIIKK